MKWITKTIFLVVVFLGLSIQGYAETSRSLINEMVKQLVEKLNADEEVALAAIKYSKKIVLNGIVFNHVVIGEDSVLLGNGIIVCLDDISIDANLTLIDIENLCPIISEFGLASQKNMDGD